MPVRTFVQPRARARGGIESRQTQRVGGTLVLSKALTWLPSAEAEASYLQNRPQPSGTSKPRWTAGRAIICSYQRFTFG